MLLDRKMPGVEWSTEDLDIGHHASPETTKRENQQLSDNLFTGVVRELIYLIFVVTTYTADGNRGIPKEEELVKTLRIGLAWGRSSKTRMWFTGSRMAKMRPRTHA